MGASSAIKALFTAIARTHQANRARREADRDPPPHRIDLAPGLMMQIPPLKIKLDARLSEGEPLDLTFEQASEIIGSIRTACQRRDRTSVSYPYRHFEWTTDARPRPDDPDGVWITCRSGGDLSNRRARRDELFAACCEFNGMFELIYKRATGADA
ncbi:hypothetical protein [Bradyrhizobium sp. SRS-191]|uniref:hypothetical protein n=1 Tax=Bradyrhizobium sp. SRS-191 TaxID=2962606 RepID=UPI00211EB1D7|nr:hypothetical protein [Bradyrhizobium sp. SRS-191]